MAFIPKLLSFFDGDEKETNEEDNGIVIPDLPSFFADEEKEEVIEEPSVFAIPELPSFFADEPEPIEIPEVPEDMGIPEVPEVPVEDQLPEPIDPILPVGDQPDTTGLGIGTSAFAPKPVELIEPEPIEAIPVPEEGTPEASAHIKNVLDNYGDRFPDTAVELVTKVEQDFEVNPQEYQTEEAANSRLLTLLKGPMGRNEKLRRAIVNKSAGFPEDQWGFALDQNEKDFINSIPEDREIKDRFFELRHPELKEGKLDVFDKLADIADRPTQLIPFVSSAVDFRDLSEILLSARRLENGTADEDDLRSLEYFVRRSEQDKTFGFKVVDVLSGLPAFMGELAATSGVFSVGKATTFKAGAKGLSKLLQKSGKDLLKKRAVELGLKATATVAGATLQTLPAGFTRIAAGTAERLIPQMEIVDSEDEEAVKILITGQGEDLMSSLLKAAGTQWVETVSERSGKVLTLAAGGARGALVRAGLIKAFKKANPIKRASDIADVLRKVGWDGMLEEVFEERVGEVGRAALGIEEYQLPTPDQLAVEFIAFAIPGVGISGIQRVAREKEAKTVPVEDQAVAEAVTKEPVTAIEQPAVEGEVQETDVLKAEAKKFDTAEAFVKSVKDTDIIVGKQRGFVKTEVVSAREVLLPEETKKSIVFKQEALELDKRRTLLKDTLKLGKDSKLEAEMESVTKEWESASKKHLEAKKSEKSFKDNKEKILEQKLTKIFNEAKQEKAVPKVAAKPVVAEKVKVPTVEEIKAEPNKPLRKIMNRRIKAIEAGNIKEADRMQVLEDALRERLELLPEQGKQLNKKFIELEKLSDSDFIKQAEKLFKETEKQLAQKTTKIKQIVRKVTSQVKPIKLITVQETAALKDQIRREVKASKLGFKEGKAFQKIVDRELKVALEKRRSERALVKKAKTLIKKETKRLKDIRKKKVKSRVDVVANDRLETYLDSLAVIPAKKKAVLEKRLKWLEENPNAELPVEFINEVQQLFRKDINEMSNDEIQGVIDDIASIKKEGKTKFEILQDREKKRRDKVAEESKTIIQSAPNTKQGISQWAQWDVSRRRKYPRSVFERMVNIGDHGKTFGWANMRPETIVEWFSGFRDSPLFDETFQVAIDAQDLESVNVQQRHKEFEAIYKGTNIAKLKAKESMKLDHKYTDEATGKGVTEKISLTADNMMFVYAHSQTEGGMSHLLGTGMTIEEIQQVLKQIPQNLKNLVDKQLDNNDDVQYPRINKVYRAEMNVSLPKVNRYFRIEGLQTDSAANAINAEILQRLGSRLASVEKGFTISRTKSSTAFRRGSYFDTVVNTMRQQEHYIAWNEPTRKIKAILQHKELQATMRAKNELAYNQLLGWERAIAIGKIESPSTGVGAFDSLNRMFDSLRLNFYPAVLGLNPVTVAKQAASLVTGAAEVSKNGFGHSMIEYSKNPNKFNSMVNEKSIMMRNRAKSFEREIAEAFDRAWERQQMGVSQVKDKMREWGMAPIRIVDKTVTNVLWVAKYQDAVNATGVEADAIKAADKLIRTTQPMGALVTLPSTHRSVGVVRAYTMFTNQLNQNMNLSFKFYNKFAQMPGTEKAKIAALQMILPGLIIYLMSNGMSFKRMKDDPEGAVAAIMMNFLGAFPFANQLIGLALDHLGNSVKGLRGAKKKRVFDVQARLLPSSLGGFVDLFRFFQKPKASTAINTISKFYGVPNPRWIRLPIKWALEEHVPFLEQIAFTKKGEKKFTKSIKDVKERVEAGDFRIFMWGEGQLEDMSVHAGMTQLMWRKTDKKSRKKFLNWFDDLTPEQIDQFKEYVTDNEEKSKGSNVRFNKKIRAIRKDLK